MPADAMTDDEIDARLRQAGTGVLSLADGAETYAVPESFGYDGDALYFQFVSEADSRKRSFVETTETATFTLFTERPARSVIVRGAIHPVPDWDRPAATEAIAANATIPHLNVSLDTPLEDLRMDLYRLTPTERSRRVFEASADDGR